MNLEDVAIGGLQQDEWSLNKSSFGEDEQFTVVGWSVRRVAGVKLYIVKCNKCAEDSELYGEGYFINTKAEILAGKISCGCNRKYHRSKEQYKILCTRKAQEIGYTFLTFTGDWKGKDTQIKMFCVKHGEWLGHIASLIYASNGCKKCAIISQALSRVKPELVMVQSFLNSGAFHPDTKFWRSDRETGQGDKIYWHMYCPECGEVGEASSYGLQQGKRPCGCSIHRQQQAYINLLSNEQSGSIVAIKFGISRDSRRRAKQQEHKSSYTITQQIIYCFDSVMACKNAERECKKEFDCGVVLSRDMPDGWTETTWPHNIDKIIEIYERNGGIRQ